MTAVGVTFIGLGLVLSIVLSFWVRSGICVPLFIYHLIAALFNWSYSLTHPADSIGYYAAASYSSAFGVSTKFVDWLTSHLRDQLDASYLDMFTIFHLFGYVGIVLLYVLLRRALRGEQQLGNGLTIALQMVIFMPGLHVWTSAIGKDGLVFLGILIFTWGAVRPQIRILGLVAGLALCGLLRPHVGAMLAFAAALAVVSSSDIRLSPRVFLFSALVCGLVVAAPFVQSFVGLENLDTQSLVERIEERQEGNLSGGSSLDISQYNLPMQVFTYLYRPLFLDANGALGMVVSLENLLYLGLSLVYGFAALAGLRDRQDRFLLRFSFLFCLLATLALATTTANLGLAIRQKTMVLPGMLLLLFSVHGRRLRETAVECEEYEEPDALASPVPYVR